MTELQQIEKNINESFILLGIKFSALQSVLNDSQLEQYHNFIIDYIETNREILEKSLSPERFQSLVDASLK